MSTPARLRQLAEWFDGYNEKTGNTNDEVQQDLREWARKWENMEVKLKAMQNVSYADFYISPRVKPACEVYPRFQGKRTQLSEEGHRLARACGV